MASEIRSIQRALLVLRTMNAKSFWSLQDLQQATELPKTTLHRILATLVAEHYVLSGPGMHGQYRLTTKVSLLSSGVSEKHRLADIGAPIVIAATKRQKWPLAIGVIEGDHVKAVMCTMPYSPYSMRPTCFGQSYGLMNSALGNAYLAFCSADEQAILRDMLVKSPATSAPRVSDIRAVINRTRALGYGMRVGIDHGESSAIAVPIRDPAGGIVGVLACSTFAAVMDSKWIRHSLALSIETAGRIAEEFSGRVAESPPAG